MGKILYPIKTSCSTFYLEIDGDVADKAIEMKRKLLAKQGKEVTKLGEQLDAFKDETPWRIRHAKTMQYLDALESCLDTADFLHQIGVDFTA